MKKSDKNQTERPNTHPKVSTGENNNKKEININ